MSDRRRRAGGGLNVNRLIPNALTLLSLAAGLTAVRLALLERWEFAVAAVILAMVFDALDGSIARWMDATSEFGAQLDSLADVISFGVTPALVLYLWSMGETAAFGWAIALAFAMSAALRLARFNVGLGDETAPPQSRRYFIGVPAPAGAGVALWPMGLYFVSGFEFFRSSLLVGIVMLVVAALMISRIPTYSVKHVRIARRQVGPVLLGVGAFAALLASTPWIVLNIAALAYVVSIPVAIRSHRRQAATVDQD